MIRLVQVSDRAWVNVAAVEAVEKTASREVWGRLLSGERVWVGEDTVAGVNLLQRTVDTIATAALAAEGRG